MRVLMFGWEFPPFNSGGLGVACEGLSRALVKHGAELIFVLPKKFDRAASGGRFLFADEIMPGIFSRRVSVDSPLAPYVTSESYRALLADDERDLYGSDLLYEVKRYARAARRIAARGGFDVIHAHDWLSFLAGIAAKRASGKPLIVHVHATEFDRTGGARPHAEVFSVERAGLEAADLVLAVSGYTKREIVRRYGIPSEKIAVCHNGIDMRESVAAPPLPARKHRRIVLFVGRLTLQKGPDYFIRAAKLAAAHEPDALFVIAGSGDMERQLIELSAELGLNDRVVFAGFVRGRELARLYASASLFVLPSVSEPFGLTALEAARARIPVILSKQAGVGELLRHVFRVDFWDVRAIASHIVGLLRYPALRAAMSEAAHEEVKTRSWEQSAERCMNAYASLAPRAGFA